MKQCYICGDILIKNINRSKDHVPPDCIFPTNKPPNLITIPCCKSCNARFEQLDEKMGNFLSLISITKSGNVGQKSLRILRRSRKIRDEFLSHTKEHTTLQDENGNPRLEFYFDDNELNTWLIRLVKGLTYRFYKNRISDNAIYNIEKYPQFAPQPSESFPKEKGLEFRPYFYYSVIKEPKNDFWVLYFYDDLIFSVTVNITG